jgi:mRNA-degrading endonuclease RelE of RelBE toxin-antitoxin system
MRSKIAITDEFWDSVIQLPDYPNSFESVKRLLQRLQTEPAMGRRVVVDDTNIYIARMNDLRIFYTIDRESETMIMLNAATDSDLERAAFEARRAADIGGDIDKRRRDS